MSALDDCERDTILLTLEACRGNRGETARQLDISPATLYRRLARYRAEGYAERITRIGVTVDEAPPQDPTKP